MKTVWGQFIIPEGWEMVKKSEPDWEWPEWLTAQWMAMDSNHRWYGYEKKPSRGALTWGSKYRTALLTPSILDFTPPPCDDWRDSLMENPNREACDV